MEAAIDCKCTNCSEIIDPFIMEAGEKKTCSCGKMVIEIPGENPEPDWDNLAQRMSDDDYYAGAPDPSYAL